MIISNAGNQNVSNVYQNQIDRAKKDEGASANRAANREDSVELSSVAQLIQKAAEEANRMDEAHLARLADLKAQVADDSYQVPVDELARQLRSQLG